MSAIKRCTFKLPVDWALIMLHAAAQQSAAGWLNSGAQVGSNHRPDAALSSLCPLLSRWAGRSLAGSCNLNQCKLEEQTGCWAVRALKPAGSLQRLELCLHAAGGGG